MTKATIARPLALACALDAVLITASGAQAVSPGQQPRLPDRGLACKHRKLALLPRYVAARITALPVSEVAIP
jgi:hypothetical protein